MSENICCYEVKKATTAINFLRWAIGGMLITLLTAAPLAYGAAKDSAKETNDKIDAVIESVHRIEITLTKVNTIQEETIRRFEEHREDRLKEREKEKGGD